MWQLPKNLKPWLWNFEPRRHESFHEWASSCVTKIKSLNFFAVDQDLDLWPLCSHCCWNWHNYCQFWVYWCCHWGYWWYLWCSWRPSSPNMSQLYWDILATDYRLSGWTWTCSPSSLWEPPFLLIQQSLQITKNRKLLFGKIKNKIIFSMCHLIFQIMTDNM